MKASIGSGCHASRCENGAGRTLTIDWGFLDGRFGSVCQPGPGQPGLPTRLVAGLFVLKHMHNLSDEVLCARTALMRSPSRPLTLEVIPVHAVVILLHCRGRPA
jgi:hypothetical protein